ncbi:MAG: DUF6922 domain-containing protein [Terriglobales bacterium]
MIPKELRNFFWDISTDHFNPHERPQYAIGRILELGTEEAVDWMKSTFTEDEIKKVIREDRHLSPRSANYWALIYRIPTEEVAALAQHPASL